MKTSHLIGKNVSLLLHRQQHNHTTEHVLEDLIGLINEFPEVMLEGAYPTPSMRDNDSLRRGTIRRPKHNRAA